MPTRCAGCGRYDLNCEDPERCRRIVLYVRYVQEIRLLLAELHKHPA